MADPDPAEQTERVRRFYQANAARFERLGQGGASIHRAVWGPGVGTREQAFHHVEELLLDLLPDRPVRVVDLGCGVGASLLHLAGRRADLTAEGLTISPAQARRAGELVEAAGLAGRVRCREGDFLHPPADLAADSDPARGADLVFSIEAFVHGPDPAAYFRAAAGLLRPGGTLAVCDDFLTGPEPASGPDARRLAEFRRGWRVGSLLPVARAAELAGAAGLRPAGDRDLTGMLELGRPRDRVIGLLAALGRPLRLPGEYWRSLTGGAALQQALTRGLLGYHLLVFQR